VEDSLTSGRISIVYPIEAESLLVRERRAFATLYPEADIRMQSGPPGEAVRRLFKAECDVAVLSRDLTPEERGAAARGGLDLEGYRFAKDGILVIVNPENPTENMALDVLRRIYRGEITDWSQAAGSAGPIEPVFPPLDSDLADFFVEHVMDGQPVRARAVTAASDAGIVSEVKRRRGGIGFVPMVRGNGGAKTLRIAPMTGLPYQPPDAETVYQGEYPLSRPYIFEVRASGPRLAHGFITFVTSRDGQRIVHESGLIPTAIPVRFVRRSPLRGSH
jgi:phosphate transport system substrate-binding protein